MAQPPSSLLKEFFSAHSNPTGDQIESIAKKTLLPVDEVNMWLNHLRSVEVNRKHGAEKATETRRRKKAQQQQPDQLESPVQYFCGFCGGEYEEETDEVETWIECELCDQWFHETCLPDIDYDEFVCDACKGE